MPNVHVRATKHPDGHVWAIVDAADFVWASSLRWHLDRDGYAIHSVRTSQGMRNRPMHRSLLELEVGDPRQGDHINGNRLDNRRANLRAVTAAINGLNRGSHGTGSSSYRGVVWNRARSAWQASAKLQGRNHYLGLFEEEPDAAAAVAAFWLAQGHPLVDRSAA